LTMELQNFMADLFAGVYQGRKECFFSPKKEIDFIVTRRNKPVCVGEVKWGNVKREHLKRFMSNVEGFSCDKVFIGRRVRKTGLKHPRLRVYTPGDVLKVVE
ncbi:MAG: ATP-binding protein, partial [Candidatus Altiarchaeota archaeon]|nr:ATP-binding protein [Candidatus Altiarchaeota archaeon]